MGGNNQDDEFMLNMNLSNASKRNSNSSQQPSRGQQRPRSWADKKNAKVCRAVLMSKNEWKTNLLIRMYQIFIAFIIKRSNHYLKQSLTTI
jgi:hypothetical protein